MKGPKIERIFTYRGYECVVVFTSMGHRCGYVAVPATSPLFKIDYNDDLKLPIAIEKLNKESVGYRSCANMIFWDGKATKISLICNIHGGVTYSNGLACYPITRPYPIWWFGFDCAHSSDAKDLKKLEKYFPETANFYYNNPNLLYKGQIRRINYVKGHCKKLVRQIIWLEQELNKQKEND